MAWLAFAGMSTEPPDTVTAPISEPSRTRASVFVTCVAMRKDGQPCGGAAVQGSDRCWRHSDKELRSKELAQADSIKISPLSDLVTLDITDDRALAQFRQGLLAHVGRRTLGVQEARAMHELAVAMHKDAHSKDSESAFTELARSIAAGLSQPPPGGGGISGSTK